MIAGRRTPLDGAHRGPSREIDVLVCKGFSGEIVRARIDPDETIERSLPSIADQIEYYSPDWERIGLYNMTLDFEYSMHETFREQGTNAGDLLFMADGTAGYAGKGH